ncbi:hypothetical protein JHK86_006843 [Glycine max]|nr:hypothetical protein JHK86_006843 [Glycine max]
MQKDFRIAPMVDLLDGSSWSSQAARLSFRCNSENATESGRRHMLRNLIDGKGLVKECGWSQVEVSDSYNTFAAGKNSTGLAVVGHNNSEKGNTVACSGATRCDTETKDGRQCTTPPSFGRGHDGATEMQANDRAHDEVTAEISDKRGGKLEREVGVFIN